MPDHDNLEIFVTAQAPLYEQVRGELSRGRKSGHWMWFVFPQIAGLGRSPMARRFALGSLEEAEAYLRHPVLGARLKECTRLVNAVQGRTAREIFGTSDNLKLRSSMTLFACVKTGDGCFEAALNKYFGGEQDPLTLARI
ncbi:MAG: DUF1810 domain-containing protein [Alphaproteobacteria bacterium]|jgi:uncharacterized protein (DUF1810 family)|nr:DUF1810 domain-containing protein [Alphaproteobacteria bacterium]MDP6590848.1 DUF1810 domain-containing protein [Alphaproteobacteria bacterium]MDP6816805.1 DUF1810 domain-containing protein [Alphaproteobacteria bacterium]|tara:strand:- start:1656 stop:2075 length:420 start_codon:yes stop_codon:yes gene_type:complete